MQANRMWGGYAQVQATLHTRQYLPIGTDQEDGFLLNGTKDKIYLNNSASMITVRIVV